MPTPAIRIGVFVQLPLSTIRKMKQIAAYEEVPHWKVVNEAIKNHAVLKLPPKPHRA